MSKGEGMYVSIWLIHSVVRYKLTQHCKPTILQLKKKHARQPSFPTVFSPPPWEPIHLFSVSINLPVVDISYKWNHAVYGLL